MKFNYFWIFILIPLFLGCGQTKELNDADKKLISELGFDAELIQKIRNLTDSAFTLNKGNVDEYWNFKDSLNFVEFQKKGLVGLQFNESQEKSMMIVQRLRRDFNKNGYFIYISDFNYGYSPDVVTVLKTNDKFDLLRFEGTNGINYDIYVEDIIEKISVWDKSYGLKMVGVGLDFVQADYEKLQVNLNEYAQELYEFCPDIVDQGTGTVDALKVEIIRTKELYLWWD